MESYVQTNDYRCIRIMHDTKYQKGIYNVIQFHIELHIYFITPEILIHT